MRDPSTTHGIAITHFCVTRRQCALSIDFGLIFPLCSFFGLKYLDLLCLNMRLHVLFSLLSWALMFIESKMISNKSKHAYYNCTINPTCYNILLSMYLDDFPMHVSSRFTAHRQEVLFYIYSSRYVSCVYVGWLLAASQHKHKTHTDCCIYRKVPPDDEQ